MDRILRRDFLRQSSGAAVSVSLAFAGMAGAGEKAPEPGFRAGAAEVDISPLKLPVLASGGFLERTGTELHDRLFARGLVLDDGRKRLALVVVDTLMMPREMLDEVKREASASTGIPTENILISATHTHTAPSVMGALGTGVDKDYAAFLPGKLVECIEKAAAALEPALAGWASVIDQEDTHCRVWIRRPDRIGDDPFGKPTIRAMMHPGYQNPDYLGPCGPADPQLGVLSVVRRDGSPLALLANYSMHYFGAAPVSADYFGRFSAIVGEELARRGGGRPCVAMMSHGTSGDQHWMDYSQPRKTIDMETYAQQVARRAIEAFERVEHRDRVLLDAAEATLVLQRRLPDQEREAWARGIVAAMAARDKPASQPEVYAREQIYLLDEPRREITLQALRIGDLAITAIPCEVYAITGLKLKSQSPFAQTMNIELAGGGEGYIPPPELFPFGGYNTWPARTAGLETTTEPKVVETLLGLLEKLAGASRLPRPVSSGPALDTVLADGPVACWPLDNISGDRADDRSGNRRHATFEPGVAFFLEGPPLGGLSRPDGPVRAAHFAGGRLAAACPLGDAYSVEMWICNCLPNDARAVTGYCFSRGPDGVKGAPGDHLGIGGSYRDGSLAGKLVVFNGDLRNELLVGRTTLAVAAWHHLLLVRNGSHLAVYLNGAAAPDLEGELPLGCAADESHVFIGGRSDSLFNFEGKICQVAVYDGALSARQAAAHYRAAGLT
ncbi:MAG: LamG domain-containing protein [Thermoguttaceae bacterium]